LVVAPMLLAAAVRAQERQELSRGEIKPATRSLPDLTDSEDRHGWDASRVLGAAAAQNQDRYVHLLPYEMRRLVETPPHEHVAAKEQEQLQFFYLGGKASANLVVAGEGTNGHQPPEHAPRQLRLLRRRLSSSGSDSMVVGSVLILFSLCFLCCLYQILCLEPPTEAIDRPKFWSPPNVSQSHGRMREADYSKDMAVKDVLRNKGVHVTGATGTGRSLPANVVNEQRKKATKDGELKLLLELDPGVEGGAAAPSIVTVMGMEAADFRREVDLRLLRTRPTKAEFYWRRAEKAFRAYEEKVLQRRKEIFAAERKVKEKLRKIHAAKMEKVEEKAERKEKIKREKRKKKFAALEEERIRALEEEETVAALKREAGLFGKSKKEFNFAGSGSSSSAAGDDSSDSDEDPRVKKARQQLRERAGLDGKGQPTGQGLEGEYNFKPSSEYPRFIGEMSDVSSVATEELVGFDPNPIFPTDSEAEVVGEGKEGLAGAGEGDGIVQQEDQEEDSLQGSGAGLRFEDEAQQQDADAAAAADDNDSPPNIAEMRGDADAEAESSKDKEQEVDLGVEVVDEPVEDVDPAVLDNLGSLSLPKTLSPTFEKLKQEQRAEKQKQLDRFANHRLGRTDDEELSDVSNLEFQLHDWKLHPLSQKVMKIHEQNQARLGKGNVEVHQYYTSELKKAFPRTFRVKPNLQLIKESGLFKQLTKEMPLKNFDLWVDTMQKQLFISDSELAKILMQISVLENSCTVNRSLGGKQKMKFALRQEDRDKERENLTEVNPEGTIQFGRGSLPTTTKELTDAAWFDFRRGRIRKRLRHCFLTVPVWRVRRRAWELWEQVCVKTGYKHWLPPPPTSGAMEDRHVTETIAEIQARGKTALTDSRLLGDAVVRGGRKAARYAASRVDKVAHAVGTVASGGGLMYFVENAKKAFEPTKDRDKINEQRKKAGLKPLKAWSWRDHGGAPRAGVVGSSDSLAQLEDGKLAFDDDDDAFAAALGLENDYADNGAREAEEGEGRVVETPPVAQTTTDRSLKVHLEDHAEEGDDTKSGVDSILSKPVFRGLSTRSDANASPTSPTAHAQHSKVLVAGSSSRGTVGRSLSLTDYGEKGLLWLSLGVPEERKILEEHQLVSYVPPNTNHPGPQAALYYEATEADLVAQISAQKKYEEEVYASMELDRRLERSEHDPYMRKVTDEFPFPHGFGVHPARKLFLKVKDTQTGEVIGKRPVVGPGVPLTVKPLTEKQIENIIRGVYPKMVREDRPRDFVEVMDEGVDRFYETGEFHTPKVFGRVETTRTKKLQSKSGRATSVTTFKDAGGVEEVLGITDAQERQLGMLAREAARSGADPTAAVASTSRPASAFETRTPYLSHPTGSQTVGATGDLFVVSPRPLSAPQLATQLREKQKAALAESKHPLPYGESERGGGYMAYSSQVDVAEPFGPDPETTFYVDALGGKKQHMEWRKHLSSTAWNGLREGAGSGPAAYWVNLQTGETQWDGVKFPRDQLYWTEV